MPCDRNPQLPSNKYIPNMNIPKISVIVPVYNVEQYLPRCIDSILAQTFTDFELLLIDDGSKDRSGEICDDYAKKDSRIRVFHKENGGVSSARNLGLDNAQGEWICFCDSDDEFISSTLHSYINVLGKDTDIEVISCGYTIFNNSKKTNKVTYHNQLLETNSLKLLESEKSHYYGFLWNKCIKKELATSFRFNESITWLEDNLYMYMCILRAKKIYFSSDIVYKYYYNDTEILGKGTGLSNKMLDYKMVLRAAILERDLKYKFVDTKNEELQILIDNAYKSKIKAAIYYAFACGHYLPAIKINRDLLHENILALFRDLLRIYLRPYKRLIKK